jgi:hypothetical protein
MSRKQAPVASSSKTGAFNPSKFVRPGLNEDEIV